MADYFYRGFVSHETGTGKYAVVGSRYNQFPRRVKVSVSLAKQIADEVGAADYHLVEVLIGVIFMVRSKESRAHDKPSEETLGFVLVTLLSRYHGEDILDSFAEMSWPDLLFILRADDPLAQYKKMMYTV